MNAQQAQSSVRCVPTQNWLGAHRVRRVVGGRAPTLRTICSQGCGTPCTVSTPGVLDLAFDVVGTQDNSRPLAACRCAECDALMCCVDDVSQLRAEIMHLAPMNCEPFPPPPRPTLGGSAMAVGAEIGSRKGDLDIPDGAFKASPAHVEKHVEGRGYSLEPNPARPEACRPARNRFESLWRGIEKSKHFAHAAGTPSAARLAGLALLPKDRKWS